MMVIGLIMRAAQGNLLELDPAFFYQLLSVHGAGMVGTAGLSGAAIMWYFVGRLRGAERGHVLGVSRPVSAGSGLHPGGDFRRPVRRSLDVSVSPAGDLRGRLGAVGSGTLHARLCVDRCRFLLYYLAVGHALIRQFGGLANALGWRWASAVRTPKPLRRRRIVAAAAVTVFNTIGIVVGAAVLGGQPGAPFGAGVCGECPACEEHDLFLRACVHQCVDLHGGDCGLRSHSEYTGKPWKTSRVFVLSWTAILLFVMAVYPHHLLQDHVMPAWALVAGQVISYLSGIPLLAVTAYSLCVYLYGSKLRWDLASSLLVLAVAGGRWGRCRRSSTAW